MVYCAEGDCSNNTKGKSRKEPFVSVWPGRKFIRFYKMPDPERSVEAKKLFKKWRLRVQRRPEDITKKSWVCSEHFCDDDFRPSDLEYTKTMESLSKKWIRLKPDAVPNTDRSTGEIKIHVKSKLSSDHAKRDMPGRKRVRRDIEYIDELLAENEAKIGADSSSAILDVTTKEDESQLEEILDAYQVHSDNIQGRYLSALISADTNNDKGVQCSPCTANCSTQTGLSSMVQDLQSERGTTSVDQGCPTMQSDSVSMEDTDREDLDSNEDDSPGSGPSLTQAQSLGKKVKPHFKTYVVCIGQGAEKNLIYNTQLISTISIYLKVFKNPSIQKSIQKKNIRN